MREDIFVLIFDVSLELRMFASTEEVVNKNGMNEWMFSYANVQKIL